MAHRDIIACAILAAGVLASFAGAEQQPQRRPEMVARLQKEYAVWAAEVAESSETPMGQEKQ